MQPSTVYSFVFRIRVRGSRYENSSTVRIAVRNALGTLCVVRAPGKMCVLCVYDVVNGEHIKQRDNENRTSVHISTLG